jgi:lipopolysaccharide export system protein LptA
MAMTRQLILSTALGALLAAAAASGAANAQIGRGDSAIRITAKTSEYLQNEGRGIWAGDVVAVQADSQIHSDKLTAICTKPKQAGQGANQSCEEIEKLVAEGNVLYTAPDVKIRGDKAEYDYTTHVITITGDVISSRGDEGVVRGTQIVYNIDEGHVRVTAGDKRVLSIITPKKKTETAQPAAPGQPAPVQPVTPTPAPAAPN